MHYISSELEEFYSSISVRDRERKERHISCSDEWILSFGFLKESKGSFDDPIERFECQVAPIDEIEWNILKRTAAIHSFRALPSDSRRNKINMSSNLPMIYGRSVCSKVGEGCPPVITQLLIIETPVYVRLPRINLWFRAILRQRLTSKRTSRWKLRFPSFYTPRPYLALSLYSTIFLDSFRSPSVQTRRF